MPIDYQRLKDRLFDDIEQSYTAWDTILYALGLGLGQDPLDPVQLRHVYEDGLVALPTMAVVLASPGFWLREPGTGVDWPKVLHGEQGLTIHRPLAPQGRVTGRLRIDDIVDKGLGRGALMYTTRDLIDAESGTLLCTLTSTSFLRGDGGFGGPAGPTCAPHPMPDGPPHSQFDWALAPNTALLYRLNGDLNPIHADPETAVRAGFQRPILHGLASYGVAAWSVLNVLCEGRRTGCGSSISASPLQSIRVRASGPRSGICGRGRLPSGSRHPVATSSGSAIAGPDMWLEINRTPAGGILTESTPI